MGNIRESCWSQWQLTLTTRYSLSPLLLWIVSQGLVGLCLRETIDHVIPKEGICIISDRHLSIKNGIANWPKGDDRQTRVFHRYCLRHVASNFNTHFQNSTLKLVALKAGYAN